MESSTTLTSFPQFSKLPNELRCIIWKHAFLNAHLFRDLWRIATRRLRFPLRVLHYPYANQPYYDPLKRQPRIVTGTTKNRVYFKTSSGVPSLLHACRQTRRVVFEEWKRRLRCKFEAPDEYAAKDSSANWEKENETLYRKHVAIIDAALAEMKRVEEAG